MYHDQKDGSEFSDVTLASEDDIDNSDLNECDQEVEKTPIEEYGRDVIFNIVNFLVTFRSKSKGEDLQDALQCNVSRRMALIKKLIRLLLKITS